MIFITTIQCEADLPAVLALQEENLRENLSTDEQISNGFVTLKHEPDLLWRMNIAAPTIIAKNSSSELVGYALTMLPEFASEIPGLTSLFYWIDQLEYQGKRLRDYTYYIMGQVCVKKNYRGQKIFQRMLYKHRELYSDRHQLLITSVANDNNPSLFAHVRIGFQMIHTFDDPMSKKTWHILCWDWQK